MAGVRFTEVQSRPTEFLDLTSLTRDEFEQLVAPFEDAFQTHMARWRLDGKPRTARRFSVYKSCPLPTPEDRLFFLLTYLKTYALQAALRTLGDTPARSLTALTQRLGVAEADAATVVTPLAEDPAVGPVSPLLPMTAPNDASSAPKTRLNRRRVIAARQRTTR